MPINEKMPEMKETWSPDAVIKLANLAPMECTAEDLKKINKYTLSPVKSEDVFVFKAMIADNEQDDRNCMPFNLKALTDLKRLYPGKTMLKDHIRRADSQIARIYDTDLRQDANRMTGAGEIHAELEAKIYMIRTENNKDLIAEICGGIKKEVSTSTIPDKLKCNICGGDGRTCIHWPGREYIVENGTNRPEKRKCILTIDGAKEACELSFVAVPAQPRAGTHKTAAAEEKQPKGEEETELRVLKARISAAEIFCDEEVEE